MATLFTLYSLMTAARQCSRGVKWKASVAAWIHPRNLVANCLKLLDELDSGAYKPSPYSVFRITSPKPRVIRAPKFRDRVVQRAACNLGLYDDLTRDSIHDNGACQTGKGTRFTLNRLSCHLQRFRRRHGADGWALRLDIRKFFDSIPHDRLKRMVMRKVRSAELARICIDVVDSFDDPGIGLGSQLSQLLAMSYLSDLDHYIKEKLRLRHMCRYSDDIVIIHESRDVLLYASGRIDDYLARRKGLRLNKGKCVLRRLGQGVCFMRFKHTLSASGRVLRRLERASVLRALRRLRRLSRLVASGDRSRHALVRSYMSWKAHAMAGDSHNMIRRLGKCLLTSG